MKEITPINVRKHCSNIHIAITAAAQYSINHITWLFMMFFGKNADHDKSALFVVVKKLAYFR